MSEDVFDSLPAALRTVRTQTLFVMRLAVAKILDVGDTPGASRRIGLVTGGTFDGERLSGAVLSGNDWQAARRDGSTSLDVRLVLRTHDGALITMNYRGIRHGPADVVARLNRGEAVDPGAYYFRIGPMFETASSKYDWLNGLIAVGIGHRTATGPIYSVFEVL